ncbi:cation diffusion facilitator family transporter [Sphingomonas sp. BK580]|uniref:cation diffusion facilitator family transporter n=1 Tax=Sphingomonas sp. BK580 TaxID=2586972 RepID=UPI00288A6BD7|nr:cation diffusion facilitator family transporter [Sphingomonas sp. BK580]
MVYVALAGNVLVAASKFVAAGVTGSSALLTEAVHSSADTTNQILLIVGGRRSRAPADGTHAFGYGMEIYFWTSMVAVLVLLAGGAVSLVDGWLHLRSPRPIDSPLVSLGVLVLSAVFEGTSFLFGLRAYRRMTARHEAPDEDVGVWAFIKRSKDPNLYESLLEDGAALIGLALAAAGVLLSAYAGAPWADGAASIAIGAMLVADAYVIMAATRSLTAGETVAPAFHAALERALAERHAVLGTSRIDTLHLGPEAVLVALSISPPESLSLPDLRREMADVRRDLVRVDERVRFLQFRFDD